LSDIGFLLDEHVPPIIQARLNQREPRLLVYAVGDDAAPLRGAPDSELLRWIEANQCMLITNNRATMPIHLERHLAEGRHVSGIVQLPRQLNINLVIEDLLLIWTAGEPDEFQDQILYLPLRR
jgi:hypothetical protein